MAEALPGQLTCVHCHSAAIKSDYDYAVLAQSREQDGIFGNAMLAPQPIGDVNDWKIPFQPGASLHKTARSGSKRQDWTIVAMPIASFTSFTESILLRGFNRQQPRCRKWVCESGAARCSNDAADWKVRAPARRH